MAEKEKTKGGGDRKAFAAVFVAAIIIVSVMPFIFSDDSNMSDGADMPLGAGTATPAVSVGGDHSLALSDDGTVWAWGYNNYGQLGDGTAEDQSTPVQIMSLAVNDDNGGLSTMVIVAIAVVAIAGIGAAAWFLLIRK
ncbi:MAG: RCC1 domain-containing protein [Methanomassiliicoccaceae archaeon]|nr:RCC1 domain-containing protein [Methanomassiliicoccaceae archaeon]